MEKQFLNKTGLLLATQKEGSQLPKPMGNISWLQIFKFPKGDIGTAYIGTQTVLDN